jgi:hypothetical protein
MKSSIITQLNIIDNGIIELLKRKYKIDIYHESSLHYTTIIDKKSLLENINFDYQYTDNVVDNYLSIDSNIYKSDIDIVNLIIKNIILRKKLPIEKETNKYSIIDTINYYLGWDKNSSLNNKIEYIQTKNVHYVIKDIYEKIHNIIDLFVTMN